MVIGRQMVFAEHFLMFMSVMYFGPDRQFEYPNLWPMFRTHRFPGVWSLFNVAIYTNGSASIDLFRIDL